MIMINEQIKLKWMHNSCLGWAKGLPLEGSEANWLYESSQQILHEPQRKTENFRNFIHKLEGYEGYVVC